MPPGSFPVLCYLPSGTANYRQGQAALNSHAVKLFLAKGW